MTLSYKGVVPRRRSLPRPHWLNRAGSASPGCPRVRPHGVSHPRLLGVSGTQFGVPCYGFPNMKGARHTPLPQEHGDLELSGSEVPESRRIVGVSSSTSSPSGGSSDRGADIQLAGQLWLVSADPPPGLTTYTRRDIHKVDPPIVIPETWRGPGTSCGPFPRPRMWKPVPLWHISLTVDRPNPQAVHAMGSRRCGIVSFGTPETNPYHARFLVTLCAFLGARSRWLSSPYGG